MYIDAQEVEEQPALLLVHRISRTPSGYLLPLERSCNFTESLGGFHSRHFLDVFLLHPSWGFDGVFTSVSTAKPSIRV